MRIAIVGIRGLPNNYGGFETLADYLVEYLASELDITVFCSSTDMKSRLTEYKGAKLKYIPITSHGSMGIIYDSISLIKAVIRYDKVLFLGFGGGFVMPFLTTKQKQKVILNIGGLDWKRDKWSSFAQKVIRKAEKLLIKNCHSIISDNTGIQHYITNVYGLESILIAYGGDQASHQRITAESLIEYPFIASPYAFTVTRIQSDNNIIMILESFLAQDHIPLVIVGNWNNSEYGKEIKALYLGKKNLILLDAIYDRVKLDILRSNCKIYIHGHSAGGTNPSLVEAMHLSLPIISFASGYNEYTTNNLAIYFKNSNELTEILNNYHNYPLEKIGTDLLEFARVNYVWRDVATKYKNIFLS